MRRGIKYGSFINCIDNSGARLCRVIGILAPTGRQVKILGEQIKISVGRNITVRKKVKRKEVHTMIIARIRTNIKRDKSTYIKFDSRPAGILLKMKGFFGKTLPLGTRVFGPIAKEIRINGFRKIVSLAAISI